MNKISKLSLIAASCLLVAACHQKNTLEMDAKQCGYEVELHAVLLQNQVALIMDCLLARGWTKERLEDANKAARAAAKAAETPEDRAYTAASNAHTDKLLAAADGTIAARSLDPVLMARSEQLIREMNAAEKVANAAKLAADRSHGKK